MENTQPTLANAGLAGPAQSALTSNDVRTVPGPSPGGRYAAAYPLWDGTDRLLVSWSLCRVLDQGRVQPCANAQLSDPLITPAAPLYGIFIWDPPDGTQRPVFEPVEGLMYTDVVALAPRSPLPPIVLDAEAAGDAGGIRRWAYDGTELPVHADEIVSPQITTRDIDRGAFPHFLLKEISESPSSFRKTLRGRLVERDGSLTVRLPDETISEAVIEKSPVALVNSSGWR